MRARSIIQTEKVRAQSVVRNLRGVVVCLAVLGLGTPLAEAQIRLGRKPREAEVERVAAVAPGDMAIEFAPLPESHELAPIWNDPEFYRKLVGSYGFLSDAEPRMTPEEQMLYRDQVVPVLGGDVAEAIARVTPLVLPEGSAVFDFTLGTLHFQAEAFETAIEHYERALTKFPDYRRAQQNLALVYIRAGRYREAIAPLLRTVSLGGADGRVYGLLGFAYLNEGRHLAAEGSYKQALVFDPENLEYRLGLVKCQLATQQLDAALALLDELIAQNPDRDALWVLQANVYIQKERPQEAAITLELLRRMGRATPANLSLLGDLHMASDNQSLALEAYLAAIEAGGPEDIERSLRPAEILVSRGAWDEARRLFSQIRSVSEELPGEIQKKLLRLEAKVAMATGSGEEAIRILEALVVQDPLDGDALLLAGDYYARSGEREKAEYRYEMAAKLEGYEPDALVKHAQLLVQMQKYSQAVELLRKAQKVEPRDAIQRYLEKVEQVARSGARS